MKGKLQPFSPRGTLVSHKILAKYVTYAKDSFEIVLAPPLGLQSTS